MANEGLEAKVESVLDCSFTVLRRNVDLGKGKEQVRDSKKMIRIEVA